MSAYRIVLADDHIMFREGTRKIIEESKKFMVVGEVGDGLELLSMLKRVNADMVILDISMPNLRGIEATQEIKMIYPDTKVLVLTMHKKKEFLYHAFSAGADGYLLKEDTHTELFLAIEAIRRGRIYLSPILLEEMTDDLVEICRSRRKPSGDALTTRQREILKLMAEGKSSKEISKLLFISVYTVQNHRANIIRKLNLKKMPDLVKYAINKGYVSENL